MGADHVAEHAQKSDSDSLPLLLFSRGVSCDPMVVAKTRSVCHTGGEYILTLATRLPALVWSLCREERRIPKRTYLIPFSSQNHTFNFVAIVLSKSPKYSVALVLLVEPSWVSLFSGFFFLSVCTCSLRCERKSLPDQQHGAVINTICVIAFALQVHFSRCTTSSFFSLFLDFCAREAQVHYHVFLLIYYITNSTTATICWICKSYWIGLHSGK